MIPAAALLEPIVRLRLAIQTSRDRQVRSDLREAEAVLRAQLGPSVPKRAAARLLGISVTALDRWIDRGYLPVVTSPRSSKRLGVETRSLLDLATAVWRLRRAGRSHAVISAAVRELRWRARGSRLVLRYDVARLPRPNVSLEELQREFELTTPEQRVLDVAELNRSLNILARGKRTAART